MLGTTADSLCHYHYDPLDRLASRTVNGQGSEKSFYRKNRLTTEIQGQIRRSWLQASEYLLAQQHREADKTENTLIASDIQGSTLHGLSANRQQAYAYATYGNRHPAQDPWYLPGFNRERRDPVTGHYLLGNGYRAFNPVLMRFNSPDSLSPFGKGSLNAYAYCAGDPINRIDPSGHFFNRIFRWLFGKSKTIFPAGKQMAEIDQGLLMFNTVFENKKMTVIYGHGSEGFVHSSQNAYSPEDIAPFLNAQNNKAHVDAYFVASCYSASGPNSFAKRLSALTGKPVIGNEGILISSRIDKGSKNFPIYDLPPPLVRARRNIEIVTHPDIEDRFKGIRYRPKLFTEYRRHSENLSQQENMTRIRRPSQP